MVPKEISGIIAYTVTPFTSSSGEVNLPVLGNVIERLIHAEVNAITTLGSAGECVYLDDREWESVAKKSIEIVDNRVPIIIGISELTTKKAIQKAIFAEDNGADAIMLAPMKYYELTEDEIYNYFLSVSDAISIPIMVYNNPATCGIDMSPEFILSMIQGIENVSMVKDSSPCINKLHKLQDLCGGTASIFIGCNYLALEALELGFSGWCTVAPNLINNVPQTIFNMIKNNEPVPARQLFSQYEPLLTFIVDKGLARTVKAGLELKGISAGTARNPIKPLFDTDIETLAALLFDGKST